MNFGLLPLDMILGIYISSTDLRQGKFEIKREQLIYFGM